MVKISETIVPCTTEKERQKLKIIGNKTFYSHDSLISSQHKAASMMSIYRGFYHCHDNNLKQNFFQLLLPDQGLASVNL